MVIFTRKSTMFSRLHVVPKGPFGKQPALTEGESGIFVNSDEWRRDRYETVASSSAGSISASSSFSAEVSSTVISR